MRAEIINVGTELLLGGIVNLNSRYLSEELASLGIGVYYQTSVGDNAVRLKRVLATAVSRSNIIIITGGLGPTPDDLTKETVASALRLPLIEDEASLKSIEEYFAKIGKKMPEANRKQALAPKGAVIFKNTAGTAPGYALSAGKQHIIMLPGPPKELHAMFESSVREYLGKLSDSVIVSKEIRIFGMGESEAAEKVADFLDMSNPTVAPYAKNGEVELRVTAKAENTIKAHEMCMKVVAQIEERLGNFVYTHTYKNLQETVVETLKNSGIGLSTAESCTAGLLSSRITEVPGASQVFNFGVVAYANEVKQEMLGVSAETLAKYGAVSEQTAIEMAAGARIKGKTKLGVSITGVAGPQSSEAKPVGLVYVALCDEKYYWCRELHLGHKAGDRDAIRNLSAMNALDMVRVYLSEYPKASGGKEYNTQAKETPKAEGLQKESEFLASNISNNDFFVLSDEFSGSDDYAMDPLEDGYSFLGLSDQEEKPNKFFRFLDFLKERLIFEHIKIEEESEAEEPLLEELTDASEQQEEIEQEETLNENVIILTDDLDEEEEDMDKETGFFKRLAKATIPMKGDKKGELVRKIIFLVALVVFIGAAVYLISFFSDQSRSSYLINNVREQWENVSEDDSVNEHGIYNRFQFLLEQNSDTIGWIKIENTNVDNPVFQSDDLLYYETHNMAGEESRYGALFAHPECYIDADTTARNITIYGHNTQDGSMFGNLTKYRLNGFFKRHPIIQFDTIYREGNYKIFAAMIVNALPAQDGGYAYNYSRTSFSSDLDFEMWIDEARKRSMYNTGVEVNAEDEILTLSTCVYDFYEARLVIMARRVREGESLEIDESVVVDNGAATLYPQAYYDVYGGAKPNYYN